MAEIKVPKKMLDRERQAEASPMDAQNEVIFYQLLQRQLSQLGAEAEAIERKSVEFSATKQSIKELGKPRELLVPIGSGCYMQGRFTEGKKLLVDVGAGILLPKTFAEASGYVAEKEAEASKLKADLQANANKLVAELNKIAERVKA
jgi:prefoldin alpha subunit